MNKKIRQLLYTLTIALSAFSSLTSYSQNPIQTDIISHVFYIKVGNRTGTGFLIGQSTNYLVTARHILNERYDNNDSITYYVNGGGTWESYEGIVFLHQNPFVDIAIIKPDSINEWNPPFKPNGKGLFYGEEVRFLGYPYNIITSRKVNDGEIFYPIPIIKKGMHNGVVEVNGINLLLFEGHNNSGFSGGPIISKNWQQKPISTFRNLVAVTRGFIPGKFSIDTKRGTLEIYENSGIMIGTPASYISEILELNGIKKGW